MHETIQYIIDTVLRLKKEGSPIIVAIDGRCASGKSTLADMLHNALLCNIFHMDDFYLQPHQRTDERYNEPGGNVDRERFLDEVLLNIKKNAPFSYRPFDCKTFELSDSINVLPNDINIVEGSYCMHPCLEKYYDLSIFMTVDKAEQLKRLERRSPEKLDMFKNRWIPLEEKYFEAFDIESKCDLKILSVKNNYVNQTAC